MISETFNLARVRFSKMTSLRRILVGLVVASVMLPTTIDVKAQETFLFTRAEGDGYVNFPRSIGVPSATQFSNPVAFNNFNGTRVGILEFPISTLIPSDRISDCLLYTSPSPRDS